jgi:ABC-type hemin transport system ATPase subunit
MDIAHQLELAGLLRKLADQGKGILTASHDLPWSFAFSDRIVLLDGGQKLAEGTPEEMAGKKDRMRQAMGAFLVSAESNEGFFPYVIAQ